MLSPINEPNLLGASVAVADASVLIGNPYSLSGFPGGEAYVYNLCEVCPDSDGDAVLDNCDNCPQLYNPDQTDCDDDGIGDICAIADGIVDDCNDNGQPDFCDVLSAESDDCNGNGVPDECDTARGTSTDCNNNDLLDECEIDGHDCNNNGIYDLCETLNGTTADENLDGIPDSCQVLVNQTIEPESSSCVRSAAREDLLFVGNPCNDYLAENAGSVKVKSLASSPFELEDVLYASDGEAGDEFGSEIDLDDEIAILTAPGKSGVLPNTFQFYFGAAYVYRRVDGQWIEEDILLAPTEFLDLYAESVAIEGELAAVGACGESENGFASGTVYIFRNINGEWTQETMLFASDVETGDQFGASVEIVSGHILVGSPDSDFYRGGGVCV